MCQYTSIIRYTRLPALGLLTACSAATIRQPAAPTVAITHVAVITPGVDTAVRDMTIIVQGRRVRAVGKSADVSIPDGATVTDGRGMFVIPGLWDMHVHLLVEGPSALPQYVAHGVTSVRDMGGRFETVDSLRRAVARGERAGPRVVAVGPMIENAAAMTGLLQGATHADSMRESGDRLMLSTPEMATRSVDSLAKLGVDLIKGRDFADAATYWAVASAARRNGLPFVGHAPFGLAVDPAALADSGQRTLEHWFFPLDLFTLPAAEYSRIVGAYATHGTAFTPTIAAWRQHRFTVDSLETILARALRDPRSAQAPALVAHWRTELDSRRTEIGGKPATVAQLAGWNRVLDEFDRQVRRLAADGQPILAGSDLPFAGFPGEALQDELGYLVGDVGLTPSRALVAATTAPARLHHMQDSLGTVAPRMIADLVLLDANPLTDIANVRRVVAVMQAGRWTWHRPQ